jgi:hypothetical protein
MPLPSLLARLACCLAVLTTAALPASGSAQVPGTPLDFRSRVWVYEFAGCDPLGHPFSCADPVGRIEVGRERVTGEWAFFATLASRDPTVGFGNVVVYWDTPAGTFDAMGLVIGAPREVAFSYRSPSLADLTDIRFVYLPEPDPPGDVFPAFPPLVRAFVTPEPATLALTR